MELGLAVRFGSSLNLLLILNIPQHPFMDLVLIGSFILFMSAFAGVGLASMWVKEDTTDDYLVAGRGMNPALAALSAVSTVSYTHLTLPTT